MNVCVCVCVCVCMYVIYVIGKTLRMDPRAMRVFSSSGRNLSKSRFCHIHVE